jgi:hypothetical protein
MIDQNRRFCAVASTEFDKVKRITAVYEGRKDLNGLA